MILQKFKQADYSFVQKAIPLLGFMGLMGHPLFYLVLRHGFRYWESWQLRCFAAVLFAGLIAFPRTKILSLGQKVYFEAVALLAITGLFTLFYLKNNGNTYWFSSLVFAGLLHGLISKPYVYAWSYPLGAGLASLFFYAWHPNETALLITSLQAHLVAYFMGIITTGLKTTLENAHVKIMQTRIALAQAENDLRHSHETKLAYEELKKREELIRLFVRPSLVEEIHQGLNPATFQPTLKNLAILFCDIRDFTALTEVLNPYEKQMFLNQYFSLMTSPIVQNGGEVDKIMGDCVMGVFPDGASAIQAAIAMRIELQRFNQKCYETGHRMIKNGIGIAKGEVMQGNFGSFEKLDRTVIGEAVNIASRLESKTKMYHLDIIVTEDVIQDIDASFQHYRWIDLVKVKGSSRRLKLYEIYGHQPEEVRRFKDETRELFEKALTIYFQKGFKDAGRLFKAMLARVPPHRLHPEELMDTILRYYLDHCEAWMNDKAGSWEQMDKWEGVHVFFEK